MGSIFKKKFRKKNGEMYQGKIYWIKYYRNGRPYTESSHSKFITRAERLLKKREGEIVKGEMPGIVFDKVRFDELAEDLLTDYKVNQKKTLVKAERSVKYLKRYLKGYRATEITTAKVKEYTKHRMEQGLSNASINRELAALKRIFHLAQQCTPPKGKGGRSCRSCFASPR